MAAIDFPTSPAVNQTFTAAGVTWVWDGIKWYMAALTGSGGGGGGGGGASISVGDNPPINPTAGALWFNTVQCQLYVYFNDGTSSQWVIAVNTGTGINEAPLDTNTYGRNSATWVRLSHTDITDWTTTLAPYALTTSVPLASTTTPLMDGTAAVGTGTTWARANHVHPTDTSRAAQTSLASYLPLAGGSLSGGLTVSGGTNLAGALQVNGGQIVIPPGSTGGPNPVIWLTDGSTNRSVLYFNISTGATTLSDVYSGANITMNPGGTLTLQPGPSNTVTINAGQTNLSGAATCAGQFNMSANASCSGTLTMSYGQVNGTFNVSSSASVAGGLTWGGVGGFGSGGGQIYWDGSTRAYVTCPPFGSNIGIGSNVTAAPSGAGNFIVTPGLGYQAGGGGWQALSDERIKEVESDYIIGLDEVLQLRPVNYIYKGNDTLDERLIIPPPHDPDAVMPRHNGPAPYPNSMHYHVAMEKKPFVGLIAQEVENVFPGLVKKTDGFIDGQAVTDMRHLDPSPLVYALINAVKELAARVAELEAARGS